MNKSANQGRKKAGPENHHRPVQRETVHQAARRRPHPPPRAVPAPAHRAALEAVLHPAVTARLPAAPLRVGKARLQAAVHHADTARRQTILHPPAPAPEATNPPPTAIPAIPVAAADARELILRPAPELLHPEIPVQNKRIPLDRDQNPRAADVWIPTQTGQ